MQATRPRSFGASPTESCNLLSLLPVGVGDDLGLGDRLRFLWRRSGRGSPQRRGLGPRPPPALEYQEQSEYNHYDQGAVEKGLDWFLIVNAAVLLLARARMSQTSTENLKVHAGGSFANSATIEPFRALNWSAAIFAATAHCLDWMSPSENGSQRLARNATQSQHV